MTADGGMPKTWVGKDSCVCLIQQELWQLDTQGQAKGPSNQTPPIQVTGEGGKEWQHGSVATFWECVCFWHACAEGLMHYSNLCHGAVIMTAPQWLEHPEMDRSGDGLKL